MAIDIMDEHEQGERVRAWLRDNGGAIIGGIALGLAGIFGWNWWSGAKIEHRVDAASQYQALLDASERNDRDSLDQLAESLGQRYADTPYGALAALKRAERLLEAGETAGAIDSLRRAIALSRDPALTDLARVRLARAQLGSGEHQAALDSLQGLAGDAYAGVAEELRGDALLALGRIDEARAAFAAAFAAMDDQSPSRRIVELKLTDLGGAAVETARES